MIRLPSPRPFAMAIAALLLLASAGCGYHTAGAAVRLPSDLHTIYVPTLANATQAFRVEQIFTAAIIQELHSRSNFRVVTSPDPSADATLKGTVTYAATAPLTFDSQTGKVSSSLLMISMKASLVSRSGKTLWENQNFVYREQYELSQDAASFFEEESPALLRMAHDFSRSLVSNILEAY